MLRKKGSLRAKGSKRRDTAGTFPVFFPLKNASEAPAPYPAHLFMRAFCLLFMRAYRFRLYPSKKQESLLMQHLWLAKNLWNELLEHSKETYRDFDKFPTRNALQLMVKNTGLFSQTAQEIAHRVLALCQAPEGRKH